MPSKEDLLKNLSEKTFNPMNDVAFKFIFGKEERKNITIGFLDDMLCERLEHHIQDIVYKNTEIAPVTEDGKLTRLDVRCQLDTGEEVDVEVQVLNLKNMLRRTLFYWAQMYLFSLSKGQDYSELKPAITINILAFELLPQKEPQALYTIMNPKTGDELNKDLSIFFVEIPKFAKQLKKAVSEMSRMERWMAYFANQLDEKEREELAMSNAAIGSAMDAAQMFLADPEERLDYINRQMAIMDYNSIMKYSKEEGREEGRKEGREEGRKEGRKEGHKEGCEEGENRRAFSVAKKLIERGGFSASDIADISGMQLDEVNKLIKEARL